MAGVRDGGMCKMFSQMETCSWAVINQRRRPDIGGASALQPPLPPAAGNRPHWRDVCGCHLGMVTIVV